MPALARLRFAAACAALLAGAAGAQTAIPIGGALKYDNHVVWKRIVDEAGGPGARFVVFSTAAANPERSARQIVEALNRQGAQAQWVPVAPRLKDRDLKSELESPANLELVRQARGVYFSGGAQELIVDTLQPAGEPTALLQAIWQVYRSGGVVAGSSAGAAIMSTVMFRDAQDTLRVLKGQLREGREIDRGLGFVGPELFIDQHFLKRGRFGRMLPLMQAKGYRLGLGVDEDSAAVIKGGQIEVIGAKGALLVDLSQARHEPQLGAFNVRGAQLSYLDRGDRHDLKTGVTTPSPQKAADLAIDPKAPGFKPYFKTVPFYADMLGDTTVVNAMGTLLDSPAGETLGLAFAGTPAADDSQPDLGFEFRLYKTPATRGWFTGAFGGEDYTVVRMGLDVMPVQIQRPLYRLMPVQTSR
ncbi:MAG: cyanophycinase [Roseateles sp.]